MFWRMFQMDCKRCFQSIKVIFVIAIIVSLIFITDIDHLIRIIENEHNIEDIVSLLAKMISSDDYKIVVAFALGSLYTSSVCSDDNTNYLRMILTRVDVTTYIQSRFIVNILAIVSTCIVSFLMFALMASPICALWNPENISVQHYYVGVLEISPILYIMMQGLQYGMIVAACSSIGLLFSVYQANGFVSIGLVGMTIFCALSYLPEGTIFSIIDLSALYPNTVLRDYPPLVNYGWGILYPTIVIVICGVLFYRRMKWRMENGYI